MKRNKLTLILAVLLLATMLLTSCTQPEPEEPANEPLLNIVENDHSEAISAWAEYLSYIAPEATPNYSATEILSGLDAPADISDVIFAVEEIKENVKLVEPALEEEPGEEAGEGEVGEGEGEVGAEEEPAEPIEVLVSTTYTVKWYNKDTGAFIKSFTSVIAEKTLVEGVLKYDETVNPLDLIRYDISYDENGLIMVKTTTLALVEQEEAAEGEEVEPLDLKAVSSYTEETVISYYYADGSLFLDKLDSELVYRPVDNISAMMAGRYLLDSKELGKTFLMENGAVVREFAYKMEYNIPVYDAESTNVNGSGYAYFEKNGNKYVVKEDAPTYIPMGELYLYLVQGMSINVTDKDDKVLVNYTASCYGISGYVVLSNGNIFICEFELLNRDATEYDIISGEDKLNVHNKLISIADGSVTELDINFKASKLFNNTTKEIKTFMNYATLGIESDMEHTLLDSASVKEGYILAEIQKYEAGNLDAATTWVVLDESFNIVKELPTIIADQFTYPSFMSANVMVISARTVGNKLVYYGADVKTGEITLLPSLNSLQKVQVINNGYFWNKKVYSAEWKLLYDFNPDYSSSYYNIYDDFRIINGTLYYSYHSSSMVDSISWSIAKIEIIANEQVRDKWEYDEELGYQVYVPETFISYSTQTTNLHDNAKFYADGIIYKTYDGYDKYYDLNSQIIVEEYLTTEFVMSEKLESSVPYQVIRTIYDIEEIEGGYLVCIRNSYTMSSDYYLETSELPLSFVEYNYYIIK